MVNTVDLYDELHEKGVKFYPWKLDKEKSTIIELNKRYAVFVDFNSIRSSVEERVVVAHEYGHIETGATHSICSPYDLVARHEIKADKHAIKRLIPKHELDDAVASGRTEVWDLADYFGVTEEFMKKAVCWYTHGNLAADLYFSTN